MDYDRATVTELLTAYINKQKNLESTYMEMRKALIKMFILVLLGIVQGTFFVCTYWARIKMDWTLLYIYDIVATIMFFFIIFRFREAVKEWKEVGLAK